MHVNTEALVDIAEGTQLESSAPHLARCESCRAQLRDLRAMMSAARSVDVPEPSPLFWNHLSSRVSEAVVADAVPRRSWLDVARWRRIAVDPMSAVGAAALLMLVLFRTLVTVPAPAAHSPLMSVAGAGAATELLSDFGDDDASLTVVASFTDDQDIETVREAGLAPRGTADHAVAHLSDSELRELGRLLKEELTRSGA
jgi:hypothetical protein